MARQNSTLHPGDKDRLVTLQEWTETGTDDRGHTEGSWGNLAANATEWVGIKPLTARTAEYAHQLFTEATHQVRMDYRADVTKEFRLLYGSRALHIGHVINIDEANIMLELLCVEGDP